MAARRAESGSAATRAVVSAIEESGNGRVLGILADSIGGEGSATSDAPKVRVIEPNFRSDLKLDPCLVAI